jgi:hypothetical protein
LSAQLLDRNALTSRIDRLESLLLSVVCKTTAHLPSPAPSNGVPQFPNVSQGTSNDLGNHIAQIEQEMGRESVDIELLEKELGVTKVEPTQSFYHGGQHRVSIICQVWLPMALAGQTHLMTILDSRIQRLSGSPLR